MHRESVPYGIIPPVAHLASARDPLSKDNGVICVDDDDDDDGEADDPNSAPQTGAPAAVVFDESWLLRFVRAAAAVKNA